MMHYCYYLQGFYYQAISTFIATSQEETKTMHIHFTQCMYVSADILIYDFKLYA